MPELVNMNHGNYGTYVNKIVIKVYTDNPNVVKELIKTIKEPERLPK